MSQGTQRISVHGTDRLGHVPDAEKFSDGGVVMDVIIDALAIPRLSRLAEAYQRIVFRHLVFRVEPMAPSMCVGGFVSGFIPDPTDNIGSGEKALERLLAVPGSKVHKAWQSAVVSHKCLPDVLYTSEPPLGDLRFSSPGRFVLIVDGQLNDGSIASRIPVSIYVDWKVDLLSPSLENEDRSGPVVAQESFYLRSQNVGLWYKDTDGGDDPRPHIPGIQFDVPYRLDSKRYVDFTDSDAGTTEIIGSFDRVMLQNHSTHGVTLFVLNYKGEIIDSKPTKNQYFLEKGDVLKPEPLNAQKGLNYLSQRRSGLRPEDKQRRLSMQSKSSEMDFPGFERLSLN